MRLFNRERLWFIVLVVCFLQTCVALKMEYEEGEDEDEDGGEHYDENVVDKMPGRSAGKPVYQYDPKYPKNVALVYWASASNVKVTAEEDAVTVGTFIATNALVCVPSTQIPITIHNVSNWYVHHIAIGDPPTIIPKEEMVVIFHPLFRMTRDSTHRIAMVVFTPEGEAKVKASAMKPLMLTAVPFLPTVMERRTDDFSLSMCYLVLHAGEGNFLEVPFVVTACRYNKEGASMYKEKVCGYTKMMQDSSKVISSGVMYPDDMGSPLICGNILVGVYAGIENLDGSRYRGKDKDVNGGVQGYLTVGEVMSNEEQYTFDVPGGLKNYEFLAGFVNVQNKGMKWSMKIEMEQTDECADMDMDENERGEDGENVEDMGHISPGPEEEGGVVTSGYARTKHGGEETKKVRYLEKLPRPPVRIRVKKP